MAESEGSKTTVQVTPDLKKAIRIEQNRLFEAGENVSQPALMQQAWECYVASKGQHLAEIKESENKVPVSETLMSHLPEAVVPYSGTHSGAIWEPETSMLRQILESGLDIYTRAIKSNLQAFVRAVLREKGEGESSGDAATSNSPRNRGAESDGSVEAANKLVASGEQAFESARRSEDELRRRGRKRGGDRA